ncbi:MAG: glycosyltransferase [Haliscomenobacter sp.]|nr:glycosyltransferase [Haliscomenobacter sp.]
MGVISRQEIALVLNRSKIGLVILHPKKNYLEALPTKLFEYMLCGIPVIASNFKLWETLVEESGAGFCVDPFRGTTFQPDQAPSG